MLEQQRMDLRIIQSYLLLKLENANGIFKFNPPPFSRFPFLPFSVRHDFSIKFAEG